MTKLLLVYALMGDVYTRGLISTNTPNEIFSFDLRRWTSTRFKRIKIKLVKSIENKFNYCFEKLFQVLSCESASSNWGNNELKSFRFSDSVGARW